MTLARGTGKVMPSMASGTMSRKPSSSADSLAGSALYHRPARRSSRQPLNGMMSEEPVDTVLGTREKEMLECVFRPESRRGWEL